MEQLQYIDKFFFANKVLVVVFVESSFKGGWMERRFIGSQDCKLIFTVSGGTVLIFK